MKTFKSHLLNLLLPGVSFERYFHDVDADACADAKQWKKRYISYAGCLRSEVISLRREVDTLKEREIFLEKCIGEILKAKND